MADEFDSSDEFDDIDAMLNASDEGIPGLEDPSEDRSPTANIASNISKAVDANLELDKIGVSFKKSISKNLPDGIGDKIDNALDAGDILVDEVMKTTTSARKSISSTVDGVADLMPDFIAAPLKTLSKAIKPESDYYGSSREMSEDERIAEQLKSILGESKSADTIRAEQASVIQAFSSEKESVILSNIAANTKAALDLKIDLDSKYYRKDLELQMKQTLTLIKIADIMSRDSEIHTKQLEAVVKNTGLPDFVKSRGSDFVKQMMMRSAGDVGLNAFKNTSIYTKAAKNATNLINGKINTFVQGTESLNGMTDMVSSMSEQGKSPVSMLIDMLVESGVNKTTDYISKKAITEILKNEGGQDAIKDLDKLMSDPEAALKYASEKSEKDDDGETSRKTTFLKNMAELSSGSKIRQSYTVNTDNNLADAAFMDNRTKKIQNEVVPNLLSKILSEVTTIRKGSGLKGPIDEDKLSYDFNSGMFKSKKDVKDNVNKQLDEKAKTLIRAIDDKQLVKALVGDSKLDNEAKQDLLNSLMKYLLAGKSTSVYYMKDEGLLNYFKNKSLKQVVDQNLDVITNPKTDKDFELVKDLNNKLTRIQTSSISNYRDIVDRVRNTTDDSVLQELGITDKQNNNSVSSSNINRLNDKFGEKHIKNMFNKEESKQESKKGFATGGGSGPTPVDEVVGEVHGQEYILNATKTKQLFNSIKTGDVESINKMVVGIAKELVHTKTVEDGSLDFNKTLTLLNSKIAGTSKFAKSYMSDLLTNETPSKHKSNKTYSKYKKVTNSNNKPKQESNDISKDIISDITSLFKTIGTRVTEIKDSTIKNSDSYIANLTTSWESASKVFNTNLDSIKKYIPTNFKDIKTNLTTLTGSISSELTKLSSLVPDSFKGYYKTLKETGIDKLATKGLTVVNESLSNNKFNTKTGIATNLVNNFKSGKPDITDLKFYTKKDTDTKTELDETIGNVKNIAGNIGKSLPIKGAIGSGVKIVAGTIANNKYNQRTGLASNLNNVNNNFNSKGMSFKVRDVNKDNMLVDAITGLGNIFKGVGRDIVNKDDKVITILDSVSKNSPDMTSVSSFMKSTSELIKTVVKDNDKLKTSDVDLTTNLDNDVDFKVKNKDTEKRGIVSEIFTKGTSKVNETISDIQRVFDGSKDVDSEVLSNIKSMDEAIKNKGVESIMSNGLAGLPLPESYSEAVHSYKQVINSMDPTGNLWINISSKDNFIDEMQNLHVKVIEEKQKGLLLKAGEKLDSTLNSAGTLAGKARDKFISTLPRPLQGYARKFLKNRFTKFGGKMVSRLKTAFGGAAKATMQEFGMLGKNIKNTFVDKHGKFRMPNAIDLTKLAGKTAFGTSKALSVGVKQLYPELFGAVKDTAGLVAGTTWDALGIKKVSKKMYNKAKAIVKPPIPRPLYNSWKSGEMTGKQVMNELNESDKVKWAEWLNANTRPGFTLPEMLATGGEWFMKTAVGTSKVVKPTYKTVGGAGLKAAGFVAKGLFNFTGIPSLFKTKKDVDEDDKKKENDKAIKERKKNPLKFIDLIEVKYLDNFSDDLNWINKDLKISKSKIEVLNKPIDTLRKAYSRGLVSKLKEINTLYVQLDKSKNMTYTTDIDNKLTELLNYINAITTKVKKGKKKHVKINDVKDDDKEPKQIKEKVAKSKKGFKVGGYTGDGKVDEVSKDVFHKREFVINSKDLTNILKDKLSMGSMKEKIIGSVKGSKLYKGIKNVKDKSSNIMSNLFGLFSKKLDFSNSKLDIIANALTKKKDYRDRDGDGDRDGNAIDRAKKLFGSSKKGDSNKLSKLVSKGKPTLLKTLMKFAPLLLAGFSSMFSSTFKVIKGIFDGVLALPNLLIGLGKTIVSGVSSTIKLLKKPKVIKTSLEKATGYLATKFNKAKSFVSNKFSKGFDFLKSKIGIPDSIKKMIPKYLGILKKLRNKIAVKLTGKLLTKVSEKIASRLIPGIGWALLAWDVGNVLKLMFSKSLSFASAVSLQFTGYDFFKVEGMKTDDISKDSGVNVSEIEEAKKKDYYIKPSNNSFYKPKVYTKTNDDIINDLKSTVSKPKPLSTDAIKVPLEPLMAHLKRDEGVRLSKYKDSLGYDTIGVGHLLDKRKGGKTLREVLGVDKETITNSESDYMLINDINSTSKELYSKLPWLSKQPTNIQTDLTNMAFNLGVNGLTKFKNSLKSIQQFDYKRAAVSLRDSLWFKQVGSRAQRIINDIAGTVVSMPEDNNVHVNNVESFVRDSIESNSKPKTTALHKDTKSISAIPNITVAPSNVTVDTKHIADISIKGNDLLSKSIKVQYGTYEKMTELVDINKNMLTVMQGGTLKETHERQTSGNNKTYSLPAYDELMSHSVKDF